MELHCIQEALWEPLQKAKIRKVFNTIKAAVGVLTAFVIDRMYNFANNTQIRCTLYGFLHSSCVPYIMKLRNISSAIQVLRAQKKTC